MSNILDECKKKSTISILHFEIHGESNGRGLVTQSGELITIMHAGAQLCSINIATGGNLFIILGVCMG